MTVFGLLGALLFATATLAAQSDYLMYVGTYTRAGSRGIYGFRFNATTGKITPTGIAAEIENPTFLAVHPNQKFLYSVSQTDSGRVSAFSIDRVTGKLTLLNRVQSHGAHPAHLSIDRDGKWLFTANFRGANAAAFPIHANGSLGEALAIVQQSDQSGGQRDPFPHLVQAAPDNRFALVVDMGLDEIVAYRLDAAKGFLVEPAVNKIPAGSGPRHLVFSRDSKFVYTINEYKSSVGAFRYDPAIGRLTELATATAIPEGVTDKGAGGEIALSPDGKFLFASVRGPDTIAVFRLDTTGKPSLLMHVPTHGKTPRHFAIDPSGSFLVAGNQDSGNVAVFRVNRETGALARTNESASVPMPACIVFVRTH